MLRPTRADDLPMYKRFMTEPGLIGRDWLGFRAEKKVDERFAKDGYLGEEDGRLVVDVGERAGMLSWVAARYGGFGSYFEIGIVLLPEFRGKGIGWRAQAMLTAYLFEHYPVQRIQAGTQPDNIAEQKALVKAGFALEGTMRAAEFRAGKWQDGLMYSRLRDDPAPSL